MENYLGRSADLQNKLNKHLSKLTGTEIDYFSKLKNADILELKTVLSDINNLLTLKLTLAATDWLCDFFKIEESSKIEIVKKIDGTKPNESGFDILIQKPIKIIGEVKCTVPINNGNKFGVAQRNSILDDLQKLKSGKKQLPDTMEFFKFVFIIDLGDRTTDAIEELLRKTKIRIENQVRLNRNIARETAVIFDEKIKPVDLDTDKVYIKTIKLD